MPGLRRHLATPSPTASQVFRFGHQQDESAIGLQHRIELCRQPNLIYNLPVYQSAKAWIISGWQVGAIVLVSTGLPFSPLISGDPLGLNSADPFDVANRLNTPNCQRNPVNPQNKSHYIKTECFAFPTPGTPCWVTADATRSSDQESAMPISR